jgi:chromosome segregation protein
VRDSAERALAAVAARREQAEEAFARHARTREALSARVYAARSAAERIGMRAERARDAGQAAGEAAARRRRELELVERQAAEDGPDESAAERIGALEEELRALERERRERLEAELEGLARERDAAAARSGELEAAVETARAVLVEAEREADAARAARRDAERAAEAARREAARVGAELAAVNQFLRSAAAAPAGASSLAQALAVEPGYEHALAAALGPRLTAGVVPDVRAGEALLDRAGADGALALVVGAGCDGGAAAAGEAPVPCARRLIDHVRADGELVALAERLLAGVWVVDSLAAVPAGFRGTAVTRAGRVLAGASGELRQAPAGGEERILERRNARHRLVAATEEAARAEAAAQAAIEAAAATVGEADGRRERAEAELRAAQRSAAEATEAARRADWLIERRRKAPDEGEGAVRRAELTAQLAAERRLAERAERERAERERRRLALRALIEADEAVRAAASRAAEALERAAQAVAARRDALDAELSAGQEVGERTAAELRACAHEEAELQGALRTASEGVTSAEVRAQQARDHAGEAEGDLAAVADRLGLPGEPAGEPLGEERRAELAARIERLARRREQLGPVNPLAKDEYEQAVAHVEELEAQRGDLEAAMAELRTLIRETDRRIREAFDETFELAATNFEELVQHLFPGGRGRLRLVQPEGPRPVLGGQLVEEAGEAAAETEEAVEAAAEAEEEQLGDEPGVEVEVTPAGKSMKRLSLLSGGEKSLVALAFMFAVFLARPCPFYILDEVEAALDDLNVDRFLQLLRRYSDRAQFIVVTHQKRTMDAADCIYGVSMGADGVSKVVSRKLSQVGEALAPPGASVEAA